MIHPCNHYSCCENYHGECYGMGCRLNPMPASESEDAVPLAKDETNDNSDN